MKTVILAAGTWVALWSAAAALGAPPSELFLPLPPGLPTYTVTDLAGDVMTRSPNGVRWLRVSRGDKLPEGQVVQVAPGAMISLKQRAQVDAKHDGRARVGGMDADEASLIINAPMLFRLGQNMLRKVELSRHFIDRLPQAVAQQAEAPAAGSDTRPDAAETASPKAPTAPLNTASPPAHSSDGLQMVEAWHKIAAILTTNDAASSLPSSDLAELEKLGMALGVASKNLQILTPATNTQISAPGFPSELTVTWEKEGDEPLDFEVYFWEARKPRSAPLALTQEDHYVLTLTTPGVFFVQVAAKNGGWQSAAHLLNIQAGSVKTPGSDHQAEVLTPSGQPQPAAPALATLDFPPEACEMRSRSGSSEVTFFWHLRQPVATREASVVVTDSAGRELMQIDALAGQTAPVRLSSGAYRWFIRLTAGQPQGSVDEQTAPRGLVILADPNPLATGLVKGVMAPGVTGVVVLEDGL